MKRRIFLAVLLSVVLSGASLAQDDAPKTPPDRVTVEELKALLADKKPVLVLDVRGSITTKIKGAAHIPLERLEASLKELSPEREIVTYCSWPKEQTSARAAQILNAKGFKARALLGGFGAWVAAGGETEPVSEATTNMAQPDKDTQQQTLGIASPNPTIDDGKTSATDAPTIVEAAPVKADATTAAAPFKTTKRSKPKRRRTVPRT